VTVDGSRHAGRPISLSPVERDHPDTFFVRPSFPYSAKLVPPMWSISSSPETEAPSTSRPRWASVEARGNCRFRHRYLWGERPGAWSDEGVTWRPPSDGHSSL